MISIVEAYKRKESYEKYHKKFRIWFPGVSVPLKSTVCEMINFK
jgi:adenylylsulfate kinase-like enzyme